MAQSTFPPSEMFEVKETSFAGRGVFATKPIAGGTTIMETDLLPAYVVYREYKREVCARCFAYDRGTSHKLKIAETGHVFCSKDCLRAWKADAGSLGLEAWTKLEEFVRKGATGGKKGEGSVYDALPDEGCDRPSKQEIAEAWAAVEGIAENIRQARQGSKVKMHGKALRNTLGLQMYPDTLSFLLSGMLSIATGSTKVKEPHPWDTVLELVADETPYASPQDLAKNVRSYLHLLCVAPLALLPHITGSNCLTLVTRDSHNSFGIRSLDDSGSEMFGYGVWPLASYFNHSCDPVVSKRRVGKAWEFWVERDIEVGEELCITYMGGDEGELDLFGRRRRSEEIWGFVCACAKCVKEEEELEASTGGSETS